MYLISATAPIPSSQSRDHVLQLDKRKRKLDVHDYGDYWADIEGDGDAVVITFGSASGPVREAIARAKAAGVAMRLIVLRLLAPTRAEQMTAALQGAKRIIVVEQNHGAQLYRYLRAYYDFPAPPATYHRPGPLPLRPGELMTALLEWRNGK